MNFLFRQRQWSREPAGSYANFDPPVRNPNLPGRRARARRLASTMPNATRSLLVSFRRAVTVLRFLNGRE